MLGVLLASSAAGTAYAGSDVTLLASRATGATGVKGSGSGSTISRDGRFVAFISFSSNLDPADTDSSPDVYVRDLQAETTQLVSRATNGDKADAQSFGGISGNGRYVVLQSSASNLDPAATGGGQHVYVRDLQTGVTTLVSRATGATGAAASAGQPSVSDDGQRIVFRTDASLDPDDANTVNDVYMRDITTNTTSLVSRAPGGSAAAGDDFFDHPAISADGRYVAFSISAPPGTVNYSDPCDVYVRDLLANTTTLVSRAAGAGGAIGNGPSRNPSISGDGRYVAFGSNASNIHPGDTDVNTDVFVRDLQTQLVTLVSHAAGPGGVKPAQSAGDDPSISADGRLVAFRHVGIPIHPDDGSTPRRDPGDDILLRDLQTGTLTLVSRASGVSGAQANDGSFFPRISGDGRVVTWTSAATNLHPDDHDTTFDVYARDPSPTPLPVIVPPPPPPPPPAAPPVAPPPPAPPRQQPGCPLTGNVIVASAGNDVRRGTSRTDLMFGLGGNDVLRGDAGRDCLYGEAGKDRLDGNAGADRLFGGPGADRLHDASGRDVFSGGAGNDRIDARDTTRAGRRIADRVTCGPGSHDVAFVDRRDHAAHDCETVRR